MYIYVLSNKGFDGWLKIGKTKCLYSRMMTLRTASPYDYEVELVVEELPCDKPVHNRLMAMGIERSREWFKAELDVVEQVIADVVAEWHPEPDSLPSDLGEEQPESSDHEDEDVRRSANLVLFKREA